MIVAILNNRVVAHADLVSECYPVAKEIAEQTEMSWTLIMRPASSALAKAIEEGATLDSLDVVVGETADLTPDPDIRTIRDHVLAKALENTK